MSSPVAVKIFSRPPNKDEAIQSLRRIYQETRFLATLRHPNVCYFFGTCLIHGTPAILLELLDGGTLAQYLYIQPSCTGRQHSEQGDWTMIASSQLLQFAKHVASGLNYLHAKGLVHRDVNCTNVLLDTSRMPTAKLCDFGISALRGGSEDISFAGTARYQAPEVTLLMACAGSDEMPRDSDKVLVSAQTDVYSYGLLLFEIMHGCVAFGNVSGLAAMILASQGKRPHIAFRQEHAALAAVLEACWDGNGERRPSMEAVIHTLNELD